MHVRWKQSGSGKTITTTTNYMGGMVFESRTTSPIDASQPDYTHRLQFIAHEEGRVRFTPLSGAVPARFSYDYFLKDHLGNTRMVLTEEASSETYPALSFEGAAGSVEVQNQDRYWENKAGQSINVAGIRTMHSTGTNAMLTRKDLGAIGAAKLLKVMSGDKIQTSVQFHYTATNANNSSASGINSLVANITQLIANSLSPSEVIKSGVSSLGSSLSSQTALANLLNTANTASGSNQAPKAYLHVLLFNDQFKFDAVNSKVIPVPYTVNSWGTLSRIGANAVSVKKNGYAYVYFSNESNELVYFDNFNLTHERGPVLEETHYYPFGLTMAGISSSALNFGKENKRKYNNGTELQSKEFSDGTGLELYATNYRSLDPQLGRFWQTDPLSMLGFNSSPYVYSSNNPILRNDPLGLKDTVINGETVQRDKDLAAVTVTPGNNRNQTFNWFGWSSTTNLNLSKSQATYNQRRQAGLSTVQLADSKWYRMDVQEYNMESRYQSWLSAKQFERDFFLIYFGASALPFIAPALLAASPELIAIKGGISATGQVVTGGVQNINVLGVAADALLSPGTAAAINGAATWKPFSNNPTGTFSSIAGNKSLTQAGIDFSTSLLGGAIGAGAGRAVGPLNGALEKGVVEFSFGVPTSVTQEIINQKLSTQK